MNSLQLMAYLGHWLVSDISPDNRDVKAKTDKMCYAPDYNKCSKNKSVLFNGTLHQFYNLLCGLRGTFLKCDNPDRIVFN